MTIVADHVRKLDAQLDRIPFSYLASPDAQISPQTAADLDSPRVKELLRIVKALSTTSASASIAQPKHLLTLLQQSSLLDEVAESSTPNQYEDELEWLLVSKATVHVFGIVLDTLLQQVIPLSDHIWYWDDVLATPTRTSLYMVQTSPMRLWSWSFEVFEDSKARLQRYTTGSPDQHLLMPEFDATSSLQAGVSHQWRQFYAIVRESIREKSLSNLRRRVMSPVALARSEACKKQTVLKKFRDMASSGVGVLINEALVFGDNGSDDGKTDLIASQGQEWKGVVERSVALMDMVLNDIHILEVGVAEFEENVFSGVEQDPELSIQVDEDEERNRPSVVADRLKRLLISQLPSHAKRTTDLISQNGRPSRLVRYWLPATALLLSSSTLMRLLVNRRKEILDWVQDLGMTVRDFWFNWVVEPVRKVVGTIRHDSNSEIAIMSRDSLRADRESLERMVIDFAVDNPGSATGAASVSESQLADIRAKVKEGDVTPILRAYEKDLRSPFKGAVRGDLVRTLLIQVQKTKVDVEVAMSGIDSLLRSQELVFGFVGLTPGVLVSIGLMRYLRGALGGRKGFKKERKAGKCVRVLRNIDRILSDAIWSAPPNNVLQYKDHGMLIAEIHVLRRLAHKLLPAEVEREFLEDVDDLVNLKGIQSQVRALDRIRWAYSKWLQ